MPLVVGMIGKLNAIRPLVRHEERVGAAGANLPVCGERRAGAGLGVEDGGHGTREPFALYRVRGVDLSDLVVGPEVVQADLPPVGDACQGRAGADVEGGNG